MARTRKAVTVLKETKARKPTWMKITARAVSIISESAHIKHKIRVEENENAKYTKRAQGTQGGQWIKGEGHAGERNQAHAIGSTGTTRGTQGYRLITARTEDEARNISAHRLIQPKPSTQGEEEDAGGSGERGGRKAETHHLTIFTPLRREAIEAGPRVGLYKDRVMALLLGVVVTAWGGALVHDIADEKEEGGQATISLGKHAPNVGENARARIMDRNEGAGGPLKCEARTSPASEESRDARFEPGTRPAPARTQMKSKERSRRKVRGQKPFGGRKECGLYPARKIARTTRTAGKQQDSFAQERLLSASRGLWFTNRTLVLICALELQECPARNGLYKLTGSGQKVFQPSCEGIAPTEERGRARHPSKTSGSICAPPLAGSTNHLNKVVSKSGDVYVLGGKGRGCARQNSYFRVFRGLPNETWGMADVLEGNTSNKLDLPFLFLKRKMLGAPDDDILFEVFLFNPEFFGLLGSKLEEIVNAHKALGGGFRISKALVKGNLKALAKGASKALVDVFPRIQAVLNTIRLRLQIFLVRHHVNWLACAVSLSPPNNSSRVTETDIVDGEFAENKRWEKK
ncbi:hypothetical protein B0H16DRAFT_1814892 [Mycena metata]|uniref:Uncharacterized protein n=1 Tax=Mycena metata TaxID=1033252 RepID=A0AAD7H4J9_9AGAR|nr:hypothetical protein B0H16DRAFT_1814892 [Mycena metata]